MSAPRNKAPGGDAPNAEIAEIDVAGLAAMLESEAPPTILDVREPWELEICALPDSVPIPMAQLPGQVGALPRDRMLVVVCHSGIRSAYATKWLRQVGFPHAVNLSGGLDAWALHVDPEMRRY